MMNDNEYLLVGSEDLSREFNDLADIYSDLHKDVYGMRPRDMALCACDYPDHQSLVEAMSHLKRRFDGVVAASKEEFARQERIQQRRIAEFECHIERSVRCGAGDRATAIRWMCDSYGCENKSGTYGWEQLEFELDLPFGYIQKSMKVAA